MPASSTKNEQLTGREGASCGSGKVGKHTPGPWRLQQMMREAGHAVVGPQGQSIAFPDDDRMDGAEYRANASLIAAAPDLLAALDLIKRNRDHHAELGIYIDGTVKGYQIFDDWAADVAEAAIAKATGQTKAHTD